MLTKTFKTKEKYQKQLLGGKRFEMILIIAFLHNISKYKHLFVCRMILLGILNSTIRLSSLSNNDETSASESWLI